MTPDPGDKSAMFLDADASTLAAQKCVAANDYDGARSWLARALLADPKHLAALLTVSNLAALCGAYRNAIVTAEVAIEYYPKEAPAYRQLALCLRASNRLSEAAAAFESALRLAPDDAETCFELAKLHRALGRPEESAHCCQLAANAGGFRLDSAYHEIAGMLADQRSGDALALATAVRAYAGEELELALLEAEALLMDGRPSEALSCGNALLETYPLEPRAWMVRARASIGLARMHFALDSLRKAEDLGADRADIAAFRGLALRLSGQGQAALEAYDRAIAKRPAEARLHFARGVILRAMHLPRQAVTALDKASELAPGEAEIHFERASLLDALGQTGGANEARALARHGFSGRGGVLEMPVTTELDLEQNVSLRDWSTVLRNGIIGHGERIGMMFAFASALEARGDPGAALEMLTAANAAVRKRIDFDAGAYSDWLGRIPCLSDGLVSRAVQLRKGDRSRYPVPVFIVGMPRSGTTIVEQAFAAHPQVRAGGESLLLSELLAEFRAAGAPEAAYPDWLPALSREEAGELRRAYLDSIAARFPRARFVTDKLPGNFAHLGLIQALFPEARIVHCKRDARDVCISCYSQWFAQGHPYAYDLKDLAQVYNAYDAVMDAWRQRLPDGGMLELDYEALVAAPEHEISRLLDYCGLPSAPMCFEAWRKHRHIETASARRALLPIYQSSVGRWRQFEGGIDGLESVLSAG